MQIGDKAGIDVLDVSNAAAGIDEDGFEIGVELSLTSGFAGEAEGDVYLNVEAVLGSAFDDHFSIGGTGVISPTRHMVSVAGVKPAAGRNTSDFS